MTAPAGGTEWVIDARGCRADLLTSIDHLQTVFDDVCRDLGLVPVAAPVWHAFPDPGGVTGLQMLSESHLTCHTFPETGFAAFNLYCCVPRQPWAWESELRARLDAAVVSVRVVARG